MSSFHLTTPRAGFRFWTKESMPLALQLWGDPEVTKLFDKRGQLNEEQVRERLERELRAHEQYGIQYWPAFEIENGEFIGCCGLRPFKPEERIFEYGVHLRPAFWGMGYATELGRAVVEHAFTTLDIPALSAGHNPANHGSRKMLLKLGFEHTHDEFYPPTGIIHPSYILHRERWRETMKR